MAFSQTMVVPRYPIAMAVRRFLIWTFVLTVCWPIVGFPVFALIFIGASLLAILLQVVFSFSAIAMIATGGLAINVTFILIGALVATIWKLDPDQFQEFGWLRSSDQEKAQATFASCPLTCERIFIAPLH